MAERTKRCAMCRAVKPWTDFYAKRRNADGTMAQPHSYCKDPCWREVNKRQYWKRPEHHRQRTRAYRAANLEAARETVRLNHRRRQADPEIRAIDLDRRRVAWNERRGGTPRGPRAGDSVTTRGDFLPAAPLASFLSEYVARVGGIEQAAWAMGYKADKTLRSILHGQEFVTERVADQMLQAAGEMTLGDLYPEWREGRVAA